MEKRTIVSGMRPTGRLHLGNYWGALKNYLELQENCECYFFAADWHALTTAFEKTPVNENTLKLAADWLAAGLNPEKCVIFRQSHVKAHSELYLMLGMITPISWLLRNPTFKEQLTELYRQKYKGQEDKMKKSEGAMDAVASSHGFTAEENMALNSELSNYGFLGYPVLQAADILLYGASHVPIGKDQLPHLELTREIARRFNHIFKCKVFVEPQPLFTSSPFVPGLDKRKMSKSYGNTIELSDCDAALEGKIKKMFTDPSKLKANDKGNPDGCVVFAFHKLYNNNFSVRERECREGAIGCGACKKHLYELMNPSMKDMSEKISRYCSDFAYVEKVLKEGAEKACEKAEETMKKASAEAKLI